MVYTREKFASNEEYFFYRWLVEGREKGWVEDIQYEPVCYELFPRATRPYVKQLKTKGKVVQKLIFCSHSYTPDFTFIVREPVSECFLFSKYFGVDNIGVDNIGADNIGVDNIGVDNIGVDKITVDVKGGFNKFGDPKQFAINQKWVYDKFGIYVEKIIPEKLFKQTWCPEICRFSPVKKQPVKKYIGVPTIETFSQTNKTGG